MEYGEIDNFVKKFKELRSAGYDAKLNLESKLGEVFVSLNCRIGRDIPPPSPTSRLSSVAPKCRSPSYYRRQARRKASRATVVNLNSQDVSEGLKSQSAEQADNESTVDIDNSSELCDECKEEVHDVCLESEDSDSEESADEEADEITEVGTTEDTETIVEENSEESDSVEKQLKALIKESQKKRENWNRVTCLEENG